MRGGQREGVDAPRGQLVPDGLRQLRIGGEISEAYARNGMEFGQRAQYNAVFRKPLQYGSLRFRPGVFDKRFINDPKEIGARGHEAQAFLRSTEQPRRVAGIGKEDRRSLGGIGERVEQIPRGDGFILSRICCRNTLIFFNDASPYGDGLYPGEAAGYGVFAECGLDDAHGRHAALAEYAGKRVDELVAAASEDEAGGVHPMMPGRREHGFLGMGGRIGRECGHGPEQRGTDELRRAFGPHVHAEIQQGGRIASGGSRHAQQVAAVGFGFHNDSSF